MALPTLRPLKQRILSIYAASLSAVGSPAFVAAERCRILQIYYTPLVAPTTSPTVITPKINGTTMQLNGADTTASIAAGATILVNAFTGTWNGLNIMQEGDVLQLASNAGAANASSVPGYYTIVAEDF